MQGFETTARVLGFSGDFEREGTTAVNLLWTRLMLGATRARQGLMRFDLSLAIFESYME